MSNKPEHTFVNGRGPAENLIVIEALEYGHTIVQLCVFKAVNWNLANQML